MHRPSFVPLTPDPDLSVGCQRQETWRMQGILVLATLLHG